MRFFALHQVRHAMLDRYRTLTELHLTLYFAVPSTNPCIQHTEPLLCRGAV